MHTHQKYHEHLRSYKWKKLRAAALERAGHQCSICKNTYKLEVHHLTYARLGNETLRDLQVLCMVCHARIHTPTNRHVYEIYEDTLEHRALARAHPTLFSIEDKTGRIIRKVTTRRPKPIVRIEDFTLDEK